MKHKINMVVEDCRACTKRYDNKRADIPCIRAHKEAAVKHQPVVYGLQEFEVGKSCPFTCDWSEVLEWVKHPKGIRDPQATRCFEMIRQNLERVYSRGGWNLHEDRVADGVGYKLVGHRRQYYGDVVFVRAYPNEPIWDAFIPQYLQRVLTDLEGLGGMTKFGWAIAESAHYAPGECSKMLGEMLQPRNLLVAVGVFACFAAAQAFPVTRALAYILGVGASGADLQEAGTLLLAFARKVRDAKYTTEIDEAGKIFARFLAKCLQVAIPVGAAHMAVGAARTKTAERLFEWFCRKTRTKWEEAARLASEEHAPARVRGRWGFQSEHLLQEVHSAREAHLRQGEMTVLQQVGKNEMMALREPSAGRLELLEGGTWAQGKPLPIKLKSSGEESFHNMVTVPKTLLGDAVHLLKRSTVRGRSSQAHDFDMAMLGDRFKGGGKKPMYDLPKDIKIDGIKGKPREVEGFKLVDLGDGRYLLVDALGQPFTSDIDIIARQARRAGGGFHDPVKGSDNVHAERDLNERIARACKDPTLYGTFQHGGGGGSVVFLKDGKPGWTPRNAAGEYEHERIIVTLPVGSGPLRKGKLFILNGWKEFEEFCKANNLKYIWAN